MTTYRIWPATNGPDSDVADAAVNLGTEFRVSTDAQLTAIRYYRGSANVNPDEVRVWRIDTPITGTSLAAVVPPAATTLGWQEVPLAEPLTLTAGQAYKAVAHYPSHYVATGGYWTAGPGTSGLTNGILTAPNSATSIGGQGTFSYGAAGQYPDGTFNGGNYWVDVVIDDLDPVIPPPEETFTATTTRTGWSSPTARTGWTSTATRHGWTAGRLIT